METPTAPTWDSESSGHFKETKDKNPWWDFQSTEKLRNQSTSELKQRNHQLQVSLFQQQMILYTEVHDLHYIAQQNSPWEMNVAIQGEGSAMSGQIRTPSFE